MKTIVITLIAMLTISFSATAQAPKKNAKHTVEVNGVCGMCKKRIETAAIKAVGVKYANWDIATHQLSVIIDERKTNMKEVQKCIAAVGHDTKDVIATDEAYNSVHACCKYRDGVSADDPHHN